MPTGATHERHTCPLHLEYFASLGSGTCDPATFQAPGISALTWHLPFHLSRRPRPGYLFIPTRALLVPLSPDICAPTQFVAQTWHPPAASLSPGPCRIARRTGSTRGATHPGSHRCGRAASPSPAPAQPTSRPPRGAWPHAGPTLLCPMNVAEAFLTAPASGQWAESRDQPGPTFLGPCSAP